MFSQNGRWRVVVEWQGTRALAAFLGYSVVGGGMTRRDWDADWTCGGTGTWNIVERHLGDAGYEGAEGCTSHHRPVSISRCIPFVS